jgi:hypothetical protein
MPLWSGLNLRPRWTSNLGLSAMLRPRHVKVRTGLPRMNVSCTVIDRDYTTEPGGWRNMRLRSKNSGFSSHRPQRERLPTMAVMERMIQWMKFVAQCTGLTRVWLFTVVLCASSSTSTEAGVRPLTSRRKLNQRERHPRSKVHLNPLKFCIEKTKSKVGGTTYFLCENSQSLLTILKAISS